MHLSCGECKVRSTSTNVQSDLVLLSPLLRHECLSMESHPMSVNSLPDDKILDWSKFKAFADEKLIVTENLKFVLG